MALLATFPSQEVIAGLRGLVDFSCDPWGRPIARKWPRLSPKHATPEFLAAQRLLKEASAIKSQISPKIYSLARRYQTNAPASWFHYFYQIAGSRVPDTLFYPVFTLDFFFNILHNTPAFTIITHQHAHAKAQFSPYPPAIAPKFATKRHRTRIFMNLPYAYGGTTIDQIEEGETTKHTFLLDNPALLSAITCQVSYFHNNQLTNSVSPPLPL
jgi:hypothetical protein